MSIIQLKKHTKNIYYHHCSLTIQDTETDNTNKDPASSVGSVHSASEGSTTDTQQRHDNTDDYQNSKSDRSTTGYLTEIDHHSNTEIIEESNEGSNDDAAEGSHYSNEKENDKISVVDKLSDAESSVESPSSSAGQVMVVEAEDEAGVSGGDEGSKLESQVSREEIIPPEDEVQAKPLPSPSEMQG